MKQRLFVIAFLLFWKLVFANDGMYLSSGSVIYPARETKISIEKEILSFVVRDHIATVNIYFEFYNPEAIKRTLKVGFQAPSSSGDVDDETANTSQIKDFRIQFEDRLLPYRFYIAECEDCELKDTSEVRLSQSEVGIFVYLFEIEFKPEMNKVQHSYSFPAGNNVIMSQTYNYILTTGSKWAGGTIRDLRVEFDLGENAYFYVTDNYSENANWSIVGTGKITNTGFEFDSFNRMVRILSGYLEISVKNFVPKDNIYFGVLSDNSFNSYLLGEESTASNVITSLMYLTTDESDLNNYSLSLQELRICRNSIYAMHGYAFRDGELWNYFSQFEWYIPDPNLRIGDIILSRREKDYVNEIIDLERSLSN